MTHWHIGMKVVCIRGAAKSQYTIGGWAPKTGEVYTVRGVYIGAWAQLNLEEYHHPERHPDGSEIGWRADRFRPVTKRPTSIAIFTALLTPTEDEIFREFEAAEFDYEDVQVPR